VLIQVQEFLHLVDHADQLLAGETARVLHV
jgi:hypothetical protein